MHVATKCPFVASVFSMTRQVSHPMSRPLLALCLLLFAHSALANIVVASGCDATENNVKLGKSTVVGSTQDGELTSTGQPFATRARRGTPRSALPRWHSMLPGMIR